MILIKTGKGVVIAFIVKEGNSKQFMNLTEKVELNFVYE